MKKIKYIVLVVISLISVSCSNKGNGDKFYVEYVEPGPIVHSTLKCEAIKGGVESREPGEWHGDLMCSKCMDEQLFEIAQYGKHKDKEEEEDF